MISHGGVMKKLVCKAYLFLSIVISPPLFAGTFFLYIEETCNGERGLFLTQAREGLFDSFFESGHIIFDDLSDSGKGTRLVSKNITAPLAAARLGGADYLIALAIESTIEKKTSAGKKADEDISSRCTFLLYEVGTGRLVCQGSRSLENKGREDEFDRNKLGFELGREVASSLENHFYNP
jgi:hypothetical protein